MAENTSPLTYRYQQALAPLTKSVQPEHRSQVSKRLSELLTLLDFNTTLNRSLALSEILDLVLLVTMGEMRTSWAGVLLKREDGTLRPTARRGSAGGDWLERTFSADGAEHLDVVAGRDDPDLAVATRELMEAMDACLAVPLRKGTNLIGLLVLGEPAFGDSGDSATPAAYTEGDRAFAEALSFSAAASIDNGRVYEALRQLNRSLFLKYYQLNSLFDITRELHRARDEKAIREVLVASAMGQLLATRCALLDSRGSVESRGGRFSAAERDLLRSRPKRLYDLDEDVAVEEVEDDPLKELLQKRGFERIVPLRSGATFHGVLLVGRKASGESLSEEDRDFLRSLAAQGAVALDNLRLTREWVEKQKIEKELALARQIQRDLLPDRDPSIPGWDIAGVNIPSLAVGGDYYDYIPASGGRLGMVVADVSGKGTGPALLMASVQASFRALAGLSGLTLDVMLTRLNHQVYRSTEANRYVTVFYGCLHPENAEMEYINAGHCYPLLLRRGGEIERLTEGGPVVGLLPEVAFDVGRTIMERGDTLILYTDGLSETRSPGGEEFQEERIIQTARAVENASARDIMAKLVAEARIFAAGAGLGDDLTLMVVKRL